MDGIFIAGILFGGGIGLLLGIYIGIQKITALYESSLNVIKTKNLEIQKLKNSKPSKS